MAAEKFNDIHSHDYQKAYEEFVASPVYRSRVRRKMTEVYSAHGSPAIAASDDCIIEARPDPANNHMAIIHSPFGGEPTRVPVPHQTASRRALKGDNFLSLDLERNASYHLAEAAVAYEFAKEHLTHDALEAALRQGAEQQLRRETLFHPVGAGHVK